MTTTRVLRRLHRPIQEQHRLFLEPVLSDPEATTYTAGDICHLAAGAQARVVHLCGARPGGDVDGFARWRECDLGPWEPRPEGHYLRDLLTPVLRYQAGDTKVDVRSVGEWFGDHTDATPVEAEAAFDIMRDVLATRVPGAILWASPQATGTDLLLRTLPAGREWPALDKALQTEIRHTSTQGRIETWPLGPPNLRYPVDFYSSGAIPRLVEYDGRFMYAALCAELPEGEPVMGEGWPEPETLGYLPGTEPVMVRGRYLVEWRAPKNWAHVGILPRLGRDGWTWPADRKWSRGWVDGAELLVAERWGWEVKVRRHLCWPRPAGGGPLREWAALLVAARDHVRLLGDTRAHRFAQAGLRAMLLTTIGVLHGRGHDLTRTAPVDGQLPSGRKARLRVEANRYVWTEQGEVARPEFAHPEWSAAIWSRCRARLLDARGPNGTRTGALHLDPATIVGFSVDALYLTDDPGWADDGRPGRLTRRAVHEGPLPAPADRAELLRLLRGVRT